MKIDILNGPNLNMLGVREPTVYGTENLSDIKIKLEKKAKELGIALSFRQTNSESQLVTWIQEAKGKTDAIIINAGAYTHTSIAIFDALSAVGIPTFEIHISNIYNREKFRHNSFITPVAKGVLCGFGSDGYLYALNIASKLKKIKSNSG